MNDQKNALKAHCLCGAVTISVSKNLSEVDACHCASCQRWGGGPFFTVNCGSDINIEGAASITNYQSSEWAERGFCHQCGTHLYYHLKGANQYMLTPGLFDDLGKLGFHLQVFIDEKPDYYEFSNETQKLTGEETFKLFSGE